MYSVNGQGSIQAGDPSHRPKLIGVSDRRLRDMGITQLKTHGGLGNMSILLVDRIYDMVSGF